MEEKREGHLDPDTNAWIQEVADREYGGNWGRAAAAILESAHAAERDKDNPWAYLQARMRHRPDSVRFSGGSQ